MAAATQRRFATQGRFATQELLVTQGRDVWRRFDDKWRLFSSFFRGKSFLANPRGVSGQRERCPAAIRDETGKFP